MPLTDDLAEQLYRSGYIKKCHRYAVSCSLKRGLVSSGWRSWFIEACGVLVGFGYVLWVGLLVVEAVRLVVWGSL